MEVGVVLTGLVVLCSLASACSSPDAETSLVSAPTAADSEPARGTSARIVLVGDVMLGRKVASVVAHDPGSVFEDLRPTLIAADLALGNLESPLTVRPHVIGTNVLEADPSSAALLSGAGFDAMAIANNHAGDAGPDTVTDTIAALSAAGLSAIGAGADLAAVSSPTILVRNGIRIAVLAFDLTGGGPPAGDEPGVARWDEQFARSSIDAAHASADIVVVGIHGGVEYLPRPDPVLRGVVTDLTAWGVDVIWGTGAHVPYPVTVVEQPDGTPSVQAPGLGNALFDQRIPGTDEGAVLEVLVDANGVIATRVGTVSTKLRSSFNGWDPPAGDAVALDGEWWSPARPVETAATTVATSVGLPVDATLVATGVGDIDGDGRLDTVASYRRPSQPRLLHQAFPDVDFVDEDGRTAHLGVFNGDGTLLWGAGTLLQPVAALAACDGAVALAFSGLDDREVSAGSAWQWRDFGFATAPILPGPATAACVDLDGDGRSEPLLIRTTPSPTGAP